MKGSGGSAPGDAPPGSGWQPLSAPRRAVAATDLFSVSPFSRLARVHAFSVAADAMVATALAGSLFFSIPTAEARGKVALYLALTLAPFSVLAPLIGPAIDRMKGGRRLMIISTLVARMACAFFMAMHIDDLFLFPAAFLVLVTGKAYSIAKTSMVPALVSNPEELVPANARLTLLSAVVGFVAAGPGLLISEFAGAPAGLVMAGILSALGAIFAIRLAPVSVAPDPPALAEEIELRGAGIVLAAESFGLLRGIVGFLTFLLAFDLRGGGNDGPIPVGIGFGRAVAEAAGLPVEGTGSAPSSPTWHFGLVVAASVFGNLVASAITPRLRRHVSEERLLAGALIAVAAVGGLSALFGGLFGASLLALTVALAAGTGRLAFDSIIQRDAPDANFGRSFAGFETRFQLVWVVGCFIPVIVPIPARVGFLIVGGAAAFAAFAYVRGRSNSGQPVANLGGLSPSGGG